jgi:hypothetical protein
VPSITLGNMAAADAASDDGDGPDPIARHFCYGNASDRV